MASKKKKVELDDEKMPEERVERGYVGGVDPGSDEDDDWGEDNSDEDENDEDENENDEFAEEESEHPDVAKALLEEAEMKAKLAAEQAKEAKGRTKAGKGVDPLANELLYILVTAADLEGKHGQEFRKALPKNAKNQPICKLVSEIRMARLTEKHIVRVLRPEDIDKQELKLYMPVSVAQFWNDRNEDGTIDCGKFIRALAKHALPYTISWKTNPNDSADLGTIELGTC